MGNGEVMSKVALITGSTGFFGPYLTKSLQHTFNVVGLARHGADFCIDITNKSELSRVLNTVKPDVVFHLAAHSDVDYCEKHPAEAYELNLLATENIISLIDRKTNLVFLSSIAVYPDTPGPHFENDAAPVNVYGETKLFAEQVIRKRQNHLIIRTSIFGKSLKEGRQSLSDFIIANGKSGERLELFGDELFSPLHAETLADLISKAVSKGLNGTFNAGASDGMTKAEFGLATLDHFGISNSNVKIIASLKKIGRAKRGLDMRLNSDKLSAALMSKMPSLKEEISKI